MAKTKTRLPKTTLKKGREWLDEKHEAWTANVDEWTKNERRLEGGEDVVVELRRFDWEVSTKPGVGFQLRQDQATYVNFPEMFCDTISGHLLDNIGEIDFGGMGKVEREDKNADPSRAEQIFYNVDGVGNDGSQLKAYISAAWKRAAATGHRWYFLEMPRGRAENRQKELDGHRPYIIEYSPIRVTNWEIIAGTLEWAIVRVPVSKKRISGGVFEKGGLGYMLIIRAGVTAFDSDDTRFNKGGQFFFAEDGTDMTELDVDFNDMDGEPPFWPLFAERSKGNTERAKISRCVTSDLGNVAISYMNLSSAADFNVWNGSDGKAFITGASQDSYNLAMDMFEQGSQFAPLEGVVNSSGHMSPVGVVFSSQGVLATEAVKSRLEHKLEEARWLAAREAIGEPGSSGVSKIAGFSEAVKPRLVMFATELETWLNTMLYFFELRFGIDKPSASANWVKEFDLLSLIDKIERQFNLEKLSGLRSPTLGARAMVDAAEDSGLITDNAEGKIIKDEYLAAGTLKVETEKAASEMMKAAGVDASDNPEKPKAPKKKAGPELVE
jgi:hypothetical protein